MKVMIIRSFSGGPDGDKHYEAGQIVEQGEQHWIDKGLAVPVKDEKPAKKSAD